MTKLLAIFAHPDDESFGAAAGTLARYAVSGVDVHYLCATRGEAGAASDDLLAAHGGDIARLRTAELERAADVMGFAGLEFLTFRDSGMLGWAENLHPQSLYSAPLPVVAARIADHLRRVQPDVIVTHDKFGWYGHPDHIKCYEATLLAYEWVYGDIRLRQSAPLLYASTFDKTLVRWMARLMPLVGRDPHHHGDNGDVDLTAIAGYQVAPTASIQVGDYLHIKAQAMLCHASQKPLTDTSNGLVQSLLRRAERVEQFSRLYPYHHADEPLTDDLFAFQPRWRMPRMAYRAA